MNAKKYELTDEFIINRFGEKLFRIKALISFANVSAEQLGGYIQSEKNLSQHDSSWVGGMATVFDNARISGNARVLDKACVCGNALVSENAIISGKALVYGNAMVFGNTKISGSKVFNGMEET